MRVRKPLIAFIAIIQSVLFLTHFLLYETWRFLPAGSHTHGALWIKLVLDFLSVSFVAASLLAFRYTNAAVRAFYRAAAVWVGLVTLLFLATVSSWIIFGVARLAGLDVNFHRIVDGGFLRRMVAKILREEPDAIFIAGDLYDGTAIDAGRAAEPLSELTAPQGVYFVAGNHEQFGDDSKYLRAIAAAGVRVLSNEKVEVDGLQIIGVPYRNAAHDDHLASVLHGIRLDRDRASVLLTHAPDHPEIAEAAGVSLQLSGHTHLGQFIPWSWMARRIYRRLLFGSKPRGRMAGFTSSGAGTWGPPLRTDEVAFRAEGDGEVLQAVLRQMGLVLN